MKIIKYLILTVLISLPLISNVSATGLSLGEAVNLGNSGGIQQPRNLPNIQNKDLKTSNTIASIIQGAVNALTIVVASVAILFTIINAFLITTSSGGDGLAKAKKGLLWSIAGLFMVIFAYIIVKTIIAITYTV